MTAALTSLNLTGGNEFTGGVCKCRATGDHAAGAVLNPYSATLTLDRVAISGGTAIGGNGGRGPTGDLNDRFILNTTTGGLFFDSNGSAAGGARLIATFTGTSTAPTASDFDIV